jgi:DNA-binding response OmpR family regulator
MGDAPRAGIVGRRILLTIAEEEQLLGDALRVTLEEHGYRVTVVADKRTMVRSLRGAGRFDLLLLNEELPRLIVLDALAALRAEGLRTPAILLTGSVELTQQESEVLGVRTIMKPSSPASILEQIERTAERSPVELDASPGSRRSW